MALYPRIVVAKKLVCLPQLHFRGFHQAMPLQCYTHEYEKIGKREIVGSSKTNDPSYYSDRFDHPFPGVRFREDNTAEVLALREKERGDWRKLTIQEKKILYRQSFNQTLAEVAAPNNEWKLTLAGTLLCFSATFLVLIWLNKYLYVLPFPPSFTQEARDAQMRRMIETYFHPVTGISSEWDYEKNDWKVNVAKAEKAKK